MSAKLVVGEGFLRPSQGILFDVSQGGGEGVAVLLSDQSRRNGDGTRPPQNQWIIELSAQGGEGWSQIGRLLTLQPNDNVEPSARIVAIGNCPGAMGWQARIRGPEGQKAFIELISGGGVGSSVPGVIATQPRPRDYRIAQNGQSITKFDTELLSLNVDGLDPGAPAVWFQTFNLDRAPNPGDTPLFSRFVPVNGHFDVDFGAGDPRYVKGYAWGVSLAPNGFAPAPSLLGVESVLG